MAYFSCCSPFTYGCSAKPHVVKPDVEADSSLTQYLANSFTQDETGNLIELKRGIYGDSQFYNGEGRYHLLNTSNKWAAKALKSAGMDLSPTFKLTADSVMGFVEENRNDCSL